MKYTPSRRVDHVVLAARTRTVHSRLWSRVAAVLLVCATTGTLHAQTTNWIAAGGGNFTNAANWNPAAVPLGGAAYFRTNGTYQIDFTSSPTNSTASFEAGNATVTLNLDTNRWTITNPGYTYFAIGINTGPRTNIVRQTSGTLDVKGSLEIGKVNQYDLYQLENGTLLSYNINAILGIRSGAVITGPGSVVTNTGVISIGGNSGVSNQFVVSDQAKVFSGTSASVGYQPATRDASLLVTGTGSVLKVAGNFNLQDGTNSTVTVADGGYLRAINLYMGSGSGYKARAIVTDPGSILETENNILVGGNQYGTSLGSYNTLVVTNEGLAKAAGSVWLGQGDDPGSNRVEVVGTNSRLEATASVIVGYKSQANTLLIKDGGTVTAANLTVGLNTSASNNSVRVEDANATLVVGNTITLGPGAVSSLVITNAGSVIVTNTGNTGAFDVRNGTLHMQGGTLFADKLLATNLALSTLQLAAGIAHVDTLTMSSNATFGVFLTGTNVGVGYAQVQATGGVMLSNSLLQIGLGYSPLPGDTFTLIDKQSGGAVAGLFQGLTNNQFIDASKDGFDAYFTLRYDAGTGNDVVLFATIPEPSALMLVIGASLLVLRRQRA